MRIRPIEMAIFERTAAAAGLVLLSPFLLLVAVLILVSDGWPVWFRQPRVGLHGRAFLLLKFRSMTQDPAGARVTAARDRRITRLGAWLRRHKIDELPQLWNVVAGDMSLVGPRPEVPAFVDWSNPRWRAVLRVRPGITDPASLVYGREEDILAGASDVERFYREVVLPAKLELNVAYLQARSWGSDLRIIFLTIGFCLGRRKPIRIAPGMRSPLGDSREHGTLRSV